VIKLKDILNEIDDAILKQSSEELVNKLGADGFNTKEDAIEYLNWLKTEAFPEGLSNIPSEMTLYRVLVISDGKKIDDDKIGIHFVSTKDTIFEKTWLERIGIFNVTDYNEESSEFWLLTCKVSRNNLDIRETINNRLRYPDEQEFTLKSPQGIRVVDKERIDISDYL